MNHNNLKAHAPKGQWAFFMAVWLHEAGTGFFIRKNKRKEETHAKEERSGTAPGTGRGTPRSGISGKGRVGSAPGAG